MKKQGSAQVPSLYFLFPLYTFCSLSMLFIPSGFSLQDFSDQPYFLLQKATPISFITSRLLSVLAKVCATTSQQHQHLLIGDGRSGRYCQPVTASYLLSL